MAKTITFNYKDVDYTLEYTRSTIRKMETDLDFGELDNHGLTATLDLFKYAFYRHHKAAFKNEELIVEILSLFPNKDKLYETLTEMINDTISYLEDPDEKNAIQWNVN